MRITLVEGSLHSVRVVFGSGNAIARRLKTIFSIYYVVSCRRLPSEAFLGIVPPRLDWFDFLFTTHALSGPFERWT
jgi:hypothetical protein